MEKRRNRYVYLITYSQADLTKFPTRASFANVVKEAFIESGDNNRVLQWCCCVENHETTGKHYHVAIKLEKKQRWVNVKRILANRHSISVHFSSAHHNSYSAWRYVTKEDEFYEQSDGHPDLSNGNVPRTDVASSSRCNMARNTRPENQRELENDVSAEEECDDDRPKRRQKGLKAFDVCEIIQNKHIKNETELLALAQEQKNEGKSDLAAYIVSRTPRAIADLLKTTWDMHNAKEKLDRSTKSRLELLHEAAVRECADRCNGEWFHTAVELLRKNDIDANAFGQAVYELLREGRGKYRNLLLVGPANCGKTFLFNPVNDIFHTFSNPATGTFAWVGAEKAECIFLNDFRWSDKLIPWHDFLLMLEGQPVHLPAPKTHAEDLCFDRDTPIFCTTKHQLMYVKGGAFDARETEMMSVRWKTFALNYQIPIDEQRDIPSCPRCFAKLVLINT